MDLAFGIDYYDVSLVNGFNLPMQIKPVDFNPSYTNKAGLEFTCKPANALNTSTLTKCPANLTYKPYGKVSGCWDNCDLATALQATNPDMYTSEVVNAYCCPDTEYCSPLNPCGIGSTCKAWLTNQANCKNCSAYTGTFPNGYPTTTDLPNSAIFFHASNPNAYSFTYDDASASYTCNSTPSTGLRTKYNITFYDPAPGQTAGPTSTMTQASGFGAMPVLAALALAGAGIVVRCRVNRNKPEQP